MIFRGKVKEFIVICAVKIWFPLSKKLAWKQKKYYGLPIISDSYFIKEKNDRIA
jgi:hypothetical protein